MWTEFRITAIIEIRRRRSPRPRRYKTRTGAARERLNRLPGWPPYNTSTKWDAGGRALPVDASFSRGCRLKVVQQPFLGTIFGLCLLAVSMLCASPVYAQYAGSDALASFPADTQQMAYTNLATLRTVPQYPLIQAHLMSPQLRNLETLLQSAGVDHATRDTGPAR